MSKIQSVNSNYRVSPKSSQSQLCSSQNPSFSGGALSLEEKAAGAYAKNVNKDLGWLGKVCGSVAKNDGEVQNQLVNAIFTTTLAPAFIAFNPLSKEDQKTKEYTALRQPISAVIAIAAGLAITMPSNNFIEAIASKGTIEAIDLRAEPNKNYLARHFKKEYAKASKNGTLDQFQKENTPKGYKGEFNKEAYITAKQEQAKELYKRLMYERPEILKKDAKLNQQVDGLDRYLENNNLYKVDFKEFMKDTYKVKFFNDGSLKEHAFSEQLKKIKAADFLRQTGLVDSKFTEEDLRKFLSAKREEPIEAALSEAIGNKSAAKKIAQALGKYTSRVIQYNVKGDLIQEETVTLEQLLDALKIKESFTKNTMNKKFSTVLTDLANNHLKGMEQLKGKGLKDFANNLMAKKITRITSDFKNYKKFTGIAVALASLPISCGVLNWSYPRIVERCFPSLVKNDSKKGGK